MLLPQCVEILWADICIGWVLFVVTNLQASILFSCSIAPKLNLQTLPGTKPVAWHHRAIQHYLLGTLG
jgi:hypothetical protein